MEAWISALDGDKWSDLRFGRFTPYRMYPVKVTQCYS